MYIYKYKIESKVKYKSFGYLNNSEKVRALAKDT